ncbi:FAD dependent oxidoreductase [Ostertagia ostertagi]
MEYPHLKICLLEKENKMSPHQSGNNSGVIHAGIYYTPGTLKAKLCVEGHDLAYKFFEENNFPHKKAGKLIVAVEPEEIPRLENLYERSQKNNCKDIKMIDGPQIKSTSRIGLKALWSPHTGVVDWGEVARAFAKDFEKRGGTVYINYPLKEVSSSPDPNYPIALHSTSQNCHIHAKNLVTCTGLHSDRVAQLTGCSPNPKIIPFRGEYLYLKPEKRYLCRGNIYPVPNPGLPFLGVHFTPRMDGNIILGPNAVLAYKREGYGYFQISPYDLFDSLTYSGMRKLVFKYFNYGLTELYRGIFIHAQVKQLQRFIPELKLSDVTRGFTGVRAQAMDPQGNLVDDFVFDSGTGPLSKMVLHVRNAPSPGATSSLAIAKMIAQEAKTRFSL